MHSEKFKRYAVLSVTARRPGLITQWSASATFGCRDLGQLADITSNNARDTD